MAEAVEVAIELALLRLVSAFANANGLTVAMPNKDFEPPSPQDPQAKWLRATFLPFDTFSPAVGNTSKDEHTGVLQVDVMAGKNGGEPRMGRIASQIISAFKRGTVATSDGFKICVIRSPSRGPILAPRDEAWASLPVRVPYLCLASPA